MNRIWTMRVLSVLAHSIFIAIFTMLLSGIIPKYAWLLATASAVLFGLVQLYDWVHPKVPEQRTREPEGFVRGQLYSLFVGIMLSLIWLMILKYFRIYT